MSGLTATQKLCFDQGYEAAKAGKSMSDCPYKDKTRRNAWLFGFEIQKEIICQALVPA